MAQLFHPTPSSLQLTRRTVRTLIALALNLSVVCCHSSGGSSGPSSGNDGASGGVTGGGGPNVGGMAVSGGMSVGGTDTGGGSTGSAAGAAAVPPSQVVISAKTRVPITTTRSINYWMWSPTYGDGISGTEKQIAPLGLELMRIGGYNNDANTPDPFDHGQIDKAVAYARAIGAEPLLQVPLLFDEQGMRATEAGAAAMVTFVNITKKYGIKYFSIGNEPDLYARTGSLTDISAPAIVGYRPADYCASAKTFAAAMKVADPSLKIVGPDLAYQYTAAADWLSPILQQCGDLFDVVAIHRYPFSSAMATLPAAAADVDSFRTTIANVRRLMQAAGHGDKPLAITEMNIDYDALPASNVPAAVAGSLPSALWVADILGAAQELALRSTALWDISDDETRQFGLIGVPPAHNPRPQYYVYQLLAQHSGKTLLTLTSAPSTLHAYPTRSAANDMTRVLAVNWQAAAQVVEFRVTDLDNAPAPTTFTLPGLSVTAIDIPDQGLASAEVYGFAEHAAGTGAVPLEPGVGPIDAVDAGTPSDDRGVCAQVPLSDPMVTTLGRVTGDNLAFGNADSEWVSFSYTGTAQLTPATSVTADGNGFQMSAKLSPPLSASNNFCGFGMYFNSGSCLDASAKTGIEFELSGDLAGCSLRYILLITQDLSHIDDPGRGHCQNTDAVCRGSSTAVAPSASKQRIPFSSFAGGFPIAAVDPMNLVTMQWQVTAIDPKVGCATEFTVKNVSFY